MPALYPDYPCQVCNGAHALYYPDLAGPDLSRPWFYTCDKLPVAMRVTGVGSVEAGWREAQGALMVHCGDRAGRAET